MAIDCKNTEYGFIFGPVQVVRLFSTPKGVMIGLAPADAKPHQVHTSIWVSAKGRSVHIYRESRSTEIYDLTEEDALRFRKRARPVKVLHGTARRGRRNHGDDE